MRKKNSKRTTKRKLPPAVPPNAPVKLPAATRQSAGDQADAQSTLQSSENTLARLEKYTAGIGPIEDTRSAEGLAQEATTTRQTMLIAEVRELMERGLEANLEAGRKLNELKPLFPHGDWVPFLKVEAARFHLSFRTLQEYMRLARDTDAAIQNEIPAFFPPAVDSQSRAISDAAAQAEKEVATAMENKAAPAESQLTLFDTRRLSRPRLDGIYRISLFLTGDQKDHLDALQRSENWPEAAQKIIAVLERLFFHYGLARHGSAPDRLGEEAEARPNPYTATHDDISSTLYVENIHASQVLNNENSGA